MHDNNKDKMLNLLLVISASLLAIVILLASVVYLNRNPDISDLSINDRMRLLSMADRITPDAYQKFPPSGDMLFYHLAPDTNYQNTFGTSFTTNELGFRSPPAHDPGAANEKRLLLVGDSWTFGPGVSDGERFGRVLQNLLNANGDKWSVHNLSMIGWNTDNELNALRTFLSVLHPDIVVLCPTSNDIDDSLAVWRGRLVNDGFDSHALFRYSYEYERRWIDVFRTIDRGMAFLNDLGIPTLVYFLAEWRKLAPYYANNSGFKAKYTVVPTEYIHTRYRLDSSRDGGRHANAEGHRLIGTYLYNALIAAGLVSADAPAPLDTTVSFPGVTFDDIETDFGFWWKHAQARDLIPMDGDYMGKRGFFSVLSDRTSRGVRVRFRLLDNPGLYPLHVKARLAAPEKITGEHTFEQYVGGIQEIDLPKPVSLDTYPIIELELVCNRIVSPQGLSPVCLKLEDLAVH